MKNASRMIGTMAATGFAAAGTALALPQPTIEYNTWPTVAGSVTNTGSSGLPGTLNTPGPGGSTTTPLTGGPNDPTTVVPGSYIHLDDGSGGSLNLSTGISTNQTLNQATGTNNDFTMSAWVNLDNENGDNMVFGTNSINGAPMHLGFRGDQAYFGFWGNDSGSGNLTGNGITNGGSPIGNWNFFEWNYNASTGTQSIYENGVQIDSSGGHGSPSQGGDTLEIGTNSANSGDFAGGLDDIRVYNTSDIDPVTLFHSGSPPIPEPASLTVLGIAGLGLMARRRRA